jgi:hypothetical protein
MTEHHGSRGGDHQEQQRGFDRSLTQRTRKGGCAPQQQQWGHEQGTRCIAQPPCQPDHSERGPGGLAGHRQRSSTDRCADSGADHAGQHHEAEERRGAIEGAHTGCVALDEEGARQRFQRISDGDAE